MTDETVNEGMLDRIANSLGLPGPKPSAEAPAEEGAPEIEALAEPESVEIDWEGAKLSVPKSLQSSLMLQKDYTQKTQELADQRRTLDHMREGMLRNRMDSEFQQSVADEMRELAVIDSYLSEASKLNWAGMNLETMMRTRAEVDNVKERRSTLQQALQGKRSTFDEAVKAKVNELRAKSRELAAKSIPGFNEETEKAIKAAALAEGLTEAEIDNVLLDPRSAKILWKAMQFDKVQAGAARVPNAARALKPGGSAAAPNRTSVAELNYRKAMKGAKTSGDKANVIADRLANHSIFSKGH